jgi:hypothetical protein
MKHPQAKVSRRSFLLAATGSTAAATAVLIGTKKSKPAPAQDKTSESSKGYQLTEHVRNYYRTAKI